MIATRKALAPRRIESESLYLLWVKVDNECYFNQTPHNIYPHHLAGYSGLRPLPPAGDAGRENITAKPALKNDVLVTAIITISVF